MIYFLISCRNNVLYATSLRAASQILIRRRTYSKVDITWECKQQISVGGPVRKEIMI